MVVLHNNIIIMIIALITSLFISGTVNNTALELISDGYSNNLSCYPGDSVELYLNALIEVKNHPVNLYDLQGKTVANYAMNIFPQQVSKQRPYEQGFGYRVTKKIKIPTLKSGIYLWDNKIPLIIKSRNPNIVIVYPSNTENAYCNQGGKSLYDYNSSEKKFSPIVSTQRPIPLSRYCESFLRWMTTQNIQDTGYITDSDLDDYNAIKKSKLLIIIGHSEYWTLKARKNFDKFVDSGNDALVLSGNTMWWQVRYGKNNNQMFCYKYDSQDPINSTKLKTINWNDLSLNYSIPQSIGVEFSNAGYGRKPDKGWDGYKIVSSSPLLENTNLQKNDIIFFQSDELDGVPLTSNNDGALMIDNSSLQFEKVELIAYDKVWRGVDGIATWIVFKKTKSSGIVINTASTNWCSINGMGQNVSMQQITLNMINKLIRKENVFSNENNQVFTDSKQLN
jgi:hypothetical protein